MKSKMFVYIIATINFLIADVKTMIEIKDFNATFILKQKKNNYPNLYQFTIKRKDLEVESDIVNQEGFSFDNDLVINNEIIKRTAQIFYDSENIYLRYLSTVDVFTLIKTLKIASDETSALYIKSPNIERKSNDYYYENNGFIYYKNNSAKEISMFKNYVYNSSLELWIPLNDNNEKVYEDARSAIEYWFYNGNLKRWYPENDRGEIDKEIWFEQTPTTELRNYPMKLWSKEDKGEKINYPEEYKKKFSEERERLKLEEEKRITEEKQKLQQKIFMILGILFLVILGGFLIKRLKNKKIINDKNIELNH